MKIRNLFNLFRQQQPQTDPIPSRAVSSQQMQMMLKMLAQTETEELTCEEVYAVLDTYVEQIHRQEDAAALMPLVHHHLALCRDCREEYIALLRAVESLTE